MNFIALQFHAVQSGKHSLHIVEPSVYPGPCFFSGKYCVHGKKTHAPNCPAGLYAERIGKRLSQHLESAAYAKDDGSLRRLLQNGGLQAVLPHPEQIFHGIFGAGKKNHIRMLQVVYMLYIPQRNTRHFLKWVEIGEIGNPGNTDHGQINQPCSFFPLEALGQAVLILHLDMQVRGAAHDRDSRQFLQHGNTGVQDGPVSAEFIDHKPFHHGALIRIQQLSGSQKLGEYAAAVNIADQQDRGLCQFCHPHIDKAVRVLQIDLRGTSGSLNDNNIILCRQRIIGFFYVRNQFFLVGKILAGAHVSQNLPVDNDL